MTETSRGTGTPTQQKELGMGGRELDDDEDRQPTKTESRGQYRKREDQYLCIEIQPDRPATLLVTSKRTQQGAGE